MDWKTILRGKAVRHLGCLALTAAVALSLCLPVMERESAVPADPLAQTEIRDIQVLQAGEAQSLNASTMADPSAEGIGGGQAGGTSGSQGGSIPGEAQEPSEGAAQEEKEENVESQPQPSDGPSLEQLSQLEIGTSPEVDPNGEQGQQDGLQGEEGGEELELQLGLVMTWYKYGTEGKTIVCQPNETVGKQILTAQLSDNRLRYRFDLTGQDAGRAEITAVQYAEGNSMPRGLDHIGTVPVSVQADPGYRNYIFQVTALGEAENTAGETVEQELTFTYVLRVESGKDLELELTWQKADGSPSTITCSANGTSSREIHSTELPEGRFTYSPALLGALSGSSRITAADYRTASGSSGSLEPGGGTLELKAAEGSDRETYYLTFTAESEQVTDDGEVVRETITYQITIVYTDNLDLQLQFIWYEKGVTRRELTCRMNETATGTVKNNQLSAGSLLYELALSGSAASEAKIKAISCQSGTGATASLKTSGAVPMEVPDGQSSASYTFTVTAEVRQEKVTFTVVLRFTNDVRLQMAFQTLAGGAQILCENGRTATAETIFDDQLTDGLLDYTMTLLGEDAAGMEITSVSCYQSGTMKTLTLGAADSVQLQLADGKTGENTFTVTAKDQSSQTYTFTINVPYKHRGENIVKITTNLTDGMEVTNGTEVNLSVRAWVEDANGNTVEQILATGTNGSHLTVWLDGETLSYVSASGSSQEYTLVPQDPEVGDTNEHILYIYAEDDNGNYGELTLTLIGQRTQGGQIIGTAQIYIDMTVLGLGVQGPVSYDVLSEEPVSYVVGKALWGEDFGDPFGTAREDFGLHGGSYGGSYDVGFYLRSLSFGSSVYANAMTGAWNQYGATEAEILQAIDTRFGKGTGLATLWRCIYRNGVTLSSETPGSVGEYDYTGGSGWLYSVGSGTYYPGQSMSDYYLKDGDTLTLRYTLAKGWDIGGGTDNYGNTVGYCVSAANGSFRIDHQMQELTDPETGAIRYVCRCCGLSEDCPHSSTECRDLGDGTHVTYCHDCASNISEPQPHTGSFTQTEDPENHISTCTECGAEEVEAHWWTELSNTATCTEAGVRTVNCSICGVTQEQESPARGHQTDYQYFHDVEGHYQSCTVTACQTEIEGSRQPHSYVYNEAEMDWYCSVCGAGHGWDYDHYLGEEHIVAAQSTCQRLVYYCGDCGQSFYRDGLFAEYHQAPNGQCLICGTVTDPGYVPPSSDAEDKKEEDEEGEDEETLTGGE